MANINILPPSVYNLISAGEVVERPSSVIKELVENSIDAGSTSISISITNGGFSQICIIDNGCGMDKVNLEKCILPHSTSKLATANDLDSISTLGFRGEAMASICAVSQLSIYSCVEGGNGNFISLHGGTIVESGQCAMPNGTKIIVDNLFYNTPVRAKFLKTPKQEQSLIQSIVSGLMLANPDIKFKFICDNKTVLQSNGGLEECIYTIFDSQLANQMIAFDHQIGNYRLYGYTGNKLCSKSNRNYQYIIINGRLISDVTIQTAVAQAYGNSLMTRQYPVFVLNIIAPFNSIDVNVHPNKNQVRFEDSNKIFSMVYRAITNTLIEQEKVAVFQTYNANKINDKIANVSDLNNTNNNTEFANQINANNSLLENSTIHNPINKTKENALNLGEKFSETKENFTNEVVKDEDIKGNYLCHDTNSQNKVFNNSSIINTRHINDNNSSSINSQKNKAIASATDIEYDNFINNFFNENNNAKCVSQSKILDKIMLSDITNDKSNNNQNQLNNINQASDQTHLYNTNPNNKHSQLTLAMEKKLNIVGQIFNTYLILEYGENVYLLDQHACHEKLIYDHLIQSINNKNVEIQPLLMPYIFDCDSNQYDYMLSIIDNLNEIGFEIVEFGNLSFKLCAIPTFMVDCNFEYLVDQLINRKNAVDIKNSDLIKERLAQLACKSAIKAGDRLSENQINGLLSQMNENVPLQCPHGRPAIIQINRCQIDKMFKRIL